MIAAHENTSSDKFATIVFGLFGPMSKDNLFGMNKFPNEKVVLDISTIILSSKSTASSIG